ncbi:MXAN_6640 family putative metalloprotease [Nocardioides sp. AX2bis]|uniref:MXAN_6640 family putative metalloprotease n=1 Tax=Nocardioides sp. AX2bis TaxID=2653157 RepID=UPI0012F18355|nr:MXAN_6640 family putative metalloprotease [Nocardioides sp. AX2bis]VXC13063.1 conserved exported hypothetical protein [Nocardioides sp. AX2bis]
MRLPLHRPSVRRARTLLPTLLPALLLAISLPVTAPPASAGERDLRATGTTTIAPWAQRALDDARSALAGQGGDPGTALRVLHRALPRLGADADARAEARTLLARPTEGVADERGDGYDTPATRRCTDRVCLHWVRTGRDAPPDAAWARATLGVVDDVLALQVDELGYRAPLGDGRRGGDDRLDVYLADVGARGLFGYCAPEDLPSVRGTGTAAAYCVLDDDFARDEFGAAPRRSLDITAAHELSHAVQMAYDAEEDGWFHESTATWMEERFADGADDSRRYLPYGPLRRPGVPLDRFDPSGYAHYGAWVFWEHMSDRFGVGFVRDVWERAAVDAGDASSVQALRATLRERGVRLPLALGRFAAANLAREQEYDEGAAWPAPRAAATARVTRDDPARTEVEVDHLASAAVQLQAGEPDARLEPGRWALRVVVDGPRRTTRPVAWVVVRRGEDSVLRRVRLDAEGVGAVAVPVSDRVDGVAVSLTNGSSRSRCDQGDATYACGGTPRDDDQVFSVTAELARR